MEQYGAQYIIDLLYRGQDQVGRLTGDVSRIQNVIRSLGNTMGPVLGGPLSDLDAHFRLSDTTLSSYDRLLRVLGQLQSAQARYSEVLARASKDNGTQGAYPTANAAKAAVLSSGATVDARQEAVYKELQRQLNSAVSEQVQAAREQARQQKEDLSTFNRILQTSGQFYKTLQERNAAAAQVAANEKTLATGLAQQAEAAAKTARLGAVDQALATRPVQTNLPADVNPHVARATSQVDQAQTNLQIATLKLAEERDSEGRSISSVLAAENRVTAASIALAGAQENLARLETRTSGSLVDQFKLGFKGTNQDRSYVEQIGQAFKFSVFYGTAYKLLYGLTQTLQATLQEGIQFEQSMTELQVASGQSKQALQKLSQNLGSEAVQAGFAPSQGILVGARSLGLFGAAAGSGASSQEQAYIAQISARVVSRIAQGSGGQPADIQNNIAAIANAFGTGAEGQIRAYDLDAYLTRRFGVAQGSTLAPVSEAGTVGRAAGFSQEQVSAIATEIIARTGQTPEAVAGYMAQLFSRSGEGALTTIDQKYGINSNANLEQQFKELAKVYQNNPNSRDEISAAFGRGKVQDAVVALLQNYGDVQKEARGAVTGATGAGDAQFKLRMDNLGGQLAKLAGDLRDFADALGQSGALNVLGGVLVVFRELVESATSVLREFGQLPGVVRAAVIAIGLWTAAIKVGAVGQLGRAAAIAEDLPGAGVIGTQRFAGAQVAGAEGAAGAGLLGRFGIQRSAALGTLVTSSATGESAYLGSVAGGRALLGNVGGLGVAAAVLGDVVLWSKLHASTKALSDAMNFATTTLNNGPGPNATPDQLRAHASALQAAAGQERDSTKGVFHDLGLVGTRFSLGPSDQSAITQAGQLDAEAKRLDALAKYQERLTANAHPTQALVTGFDSQSLTASMQAITDTGGTAADKLNALNAALSGTADQAARVNASVDPHLFAGQNATSLRDAIANSVSQGESTTNPFALSVNSGGPYGLPGFALGKTTTTNIAPDKIKAALSTQDIATRLQGVLSENDLSSLNNHQLKQAAHSILLDTAQNAFGDLGQKQVERADKLMTNAIVAYLKKKRALLDHVIHGNTKLTTTELTAYVNEVVADSQALVGALPQSDFQGRIRAAEQLVRSLLTGIHHTPGGATPGAQQALDTARQQVAEAQIARFEDLRKVAQHIAKSDAQIKAIGRKFYGQEIHAAIRGGDADALANIVSQAGDWGKQVVQSALDVVLKTARAAAAMASEFAAYARNEVAGIEGMMGRPGGPTGTNTKQKKLLDQINLLQSVLNGSIPSTKSGDAYLTGAGSNNPLLDKNKKAASPGDTAAQIAAARATALAAGSQSPIAQARAAMQSASADMAAAKKGTVAYYSALQSYLEARNQLTDAIQQFHQNEYLLGHDITNPLAQARATLLAARQKLASDRGKPADVRAADLVAERQAQASVESTAFSQRLDAVQTAEQLGRMSYSAYISYLDHERNRLKNIAHRSYQQQQELNQVDQLLKTAADQMQGQWNFGDIKLPTPYQVRRYIESQSGKQQDNGAGGPGVYNDGPKGGTHVTNHNIEIKVDGADTGKVLRIIRQYLGQPGRTNTTGTRHR